MLKLLIKLPMENPMFRLATDYIENTGSTVYLTGKAGTGKTTFLRQVVEKQIKKTVVLAPTGVAAINAGGTTIHSFFGLPTKMFMPTDEHVDPNLGNSKPMLARHFHYNSEKLQLMRSMELLIIDEISMVRADLLDAVDFALRFARNSAKPFGGVQLLMIGDMYQLPPVVRNEDKGILSRYYASEYFFDAKSFKELDPVLIELDHIYRQSDAEFIDILNGIRHQKMEDRHMIALGKLFNPTFVPPGPGFITLTTHNQKADVLNEAELAKLPGAEQEMEARVEGDFFDSMFPTEKVLKLKAGAQVMFVKNDTRDGLYFNGKIGRVTGFGKEDTVLVEFPETGKKIEVQRETWENVRLNMNQAEDKIEKNVMGSFRQYPLRLAWAITIHKSQGLTFEKAVIDAGQSFAPGQVYVALSRCTSMENLVLKSMISPGNVIADGRILEFSNRHMDRQLLEQRLKRDSRNYLATRYERIFNFIDEEASVAEWEFGLLLRPSLDQLKLGRMAKEVKHCLREINDVAAKFMAQVRSLIAGAGEEGMYAILEERFAKAIAFFGARYDTEVLIPFKSHLDELRDMKKVTGHIRETVDLFGVLLNKRNRLYTCSYGDQPFYTGFRAEFNIPNKFNKTSSRKGVIIGSDTGEFEDIEEYFDERFKSSGKKRKTPKAPKGESNRITLQLFRDGKGMEEIAEERNLALGTIESHMHQWQRQGMVTLEELMPPDRIKVIEAAIAEQADITTNELKQALGDEYRFAEIRFVRTGLEMNKS